MVKGLCLFVGAACADKEAELLPATNRSALRRDAYFPKKGIIFPWRVFAQVDALRSQNWCFASSVKGHTSVLWSTTTSEQFAATFGWQKTLDAVSQIRPATLLLSVQPALLFHVCLHSDSSHLCHSSGSKISKTNRLKLDSNREIGKSSWRRASL